MGKNKKKKKGKVREDGPKNDYVWRRERKKKRAQKRAADAKKTMPENRCGICKVGTAELKANLCPRCFRRWDGK